MVRSPRQSRELSLLLLVMSCLWFYFTLCEYLTVFYGNEPEEMKVFYAKFGGEYAPYFWVMMACCFVIPMGILVRKQTRTVTGIVIASIAVCIGMWLERFTIVVPTLSQTRLPHPPSSYTPSWVEISLMVGSFAGFALAYLGFVRLFPIISLWEVQEGREEAPAEVAERVRGYFPESNPTETAEEH